MKILVGIIIIEVGSLTMMNADHGQGHGGPFGVFCTPASADEPDTRE
jgi:hypothetical protein